MMPNSPDPRQRRADLKAARKRPPGRRFGIVAAAMLSLLVLAAGGAMVYWAQAGGKDGGVSSIAVGGPFTLTDGNGKTVSEADYRGKYQLIYFGYTYCPDVCPTTLTEVGKALGALGPKADRINALFITVDPKRDTPDVVKQYAAAFSPRIVGLTGTPEQIAQVARKYRVYYAIHKTGSGPDDYSVDHSSVLYLMAPDGKFLAPISASEPAAAMAADISRQIT